MCIITLGSGLCIELLVVNIWQEYTHRENGMGFPPPPWKHSKTEGEERNEENCRWGGGGESERTAEMEKSLCMYWRKIRLSRKVVDKRERTLYSLSRFCGVCVCVF